jgi:hypothetical protein
VEEEGFGWVLCGGGFVEESAVCGAACVELDGECVVFFVGREGRYVYSLSLLFTYL